jgi:4-hydroxyphenylpyruvate dioxygenase-like putative hemolysin
VVAPLTDEGPAAEFLAAHGEGIMGINFGVANIEDAVAWAAVHGMSPQPQTGIDGEEESEVFDDMTLRTVDRSFPNGPSRSGRCDPRSSRPPLRSVS